MTDVSFSVTGTSSLPDFRFDLLTNSKISRIATIRTIINSKTAPMPAPRAAAGNESLVEVVGRKLAVVELIMDLLLVVETTDEDCRMLVDIDCRVLVDIIDDAVDCRLCVPVDDELAIAKS